MQIIDILFSIKIVKADTREIIVKQEVSWKVSAETNITEIGMEQPLQWNQNGVNISQSLT